MALTGIILFIGATVLFIVWARNLSNLLQYKHIVKFDEDKRLLEYMKGIAIFIVIAVSAGMAWG